MASITELRIQGIRAFDDLDWQVLRFYTPLTLIAGPNGVGKTTVIECLRYATTGVLPPNSKGGAFVHDPRMSGRTEVRAQIKLQFRAVQGVDAAVTRSMKANVTKAGITFKSLDAQFHLEGGREQRRSANSRVNDLDLYVPQMMGVSSSILNYVVFCHQEDSLWPLAEASVVKKRFDEIFEATKYTKALENLKILRKNYGNDIRVEQKSIEHLTQDRERAGVKKSQLAALDSRIDEYVQNCKILRSQVQVRTTELARLFEMSQQFQQVYWQLQQLEDRKRRLEQSHDLLVSECDELTDDDDASLQAQLTSMNEREQKVSEDIEAIITHINQTLSAIEVEREALASLSNRRGRIEADIEQRETRAEALKGLCGPEDPENYRHKLQARLEQASRNHESTELANRNRESQLQLRVSEANARSLQLRQAIADKSASARGLESRISSLELAISSTSGTTSKRYLDAKLAEAHEELEAVKSHGDEMQAAERSVKDAQERLRKAESAAERAQLDMQRATTIQSELAELSVVTDVLREKKCRVEDMSLGLQERLSKFKMNLGISLETEFGITQRTVDDAVVQAQGDVRGSEASLAALENDLSEISAEIESTRLSMIQREQAFVNTHSFYPPEYDTKVETAEEDVEVATQNLEQSSFTSKFYEAALNLANDHSNPRCLLCDHHKTPTEAQAFIVLLNTKIGALSFSPEQAQQELNIAKDQLDTLRKARAEVTALGNLADLVTSLEAKKHALQTRVNTEANKLKQLQSINENAASTAAMVDTLRPEISEFLRLNKDISELESKIRYLMPKESQGESFESAQQVQERLTRLVQEEKHARKGLDATKEYLSGIKYRATQIERRIDSYLLQAKETELQEQKRRQQEQLLQELRTQYQSLEQALHDMNLALPEAEDETKNAQIQLRSAKSAAATEESKLAAIKNEILSEKRQIDDALEWLRQFDERFQGIDPLAEVDARVNDHRRNLSILQTDLDKLGSERQHLERMQADFGRHRRQVHDSLQLRKLREEMRELDAQISILQEQNAEGQKHDYERETTKLQDELAGVSSDHSTKLGEVKQMREQQVLLRNELATTYHNTEIEYTKTDAHLQTTRDSVDDLGSIEKVLDSAIMKYHQVKMGEINSVLDELWKRTYMGTDIDTIRIKSEASGAGASRATYNYRVVMVKQDTELDMRGRCSAGQKVLACLIIRLALSECFGVSCGLIVLDEPTTNLDHENGEALARSLGDIINLRKQQRNFQLIVITHDERFLAMMGPEQYCSHYYRVSRDSRQLTQITREPIARLM